jgi:hypothetical protein
MHRLDRLEEILHTHVSQGSSDSGDDQDQVAARYLYSIHQPHLQFLLSPFLAHQPVGICVVCLLLVLGLRSVWRVVGLPPSLCLVGCTWNQDRSCNRQVFIP